MIAKKRKIKCYSIKKDYQTKNLKNPFFRSNKNSKSKSGRGFSFVIVSFLLLIFAIIYTLFFSPLFRITNIEIRGLGRLPQSAILQRVLEQQNKNIYIFLNQKNLLSFDKKSAELDLQTNFNFSKITIRKKIFHKLLIEIEERPYAFIWQEKDQQGTVQNYYSDSKGFIIRDSQVNQEDLKKFPIIENQTPESLIENDYLEIDPDYLNFIFSLRNEADKNSETLINKFIISQEINTIKISFQNGLLAFFNVKDDITKQLEKFLVVKREKIKDNIDKVNYVDLRYGDKVYIGNK